jgi:hypothetical protein
MTFLQRLLVLAFVPVAALLLVQSFYPSLLQEIPLYSTFFADSLPPRSETPLIVSAVPHWSHFEKIAKIATVLAELGYPITFITGHVFEKDVEKLHPLISFKPIQGKLDKLTAEEYKILETLVPGSQEQELFMMKKGMLDNIPDQYATLQEAFSEFRDKYGHDKPLLSLYDTLFEGHHPVSLAAPGLKPDANIGLACHPMTVDSNDTLPFYIGKPPLQSPDAKAAHHKVNQAGEQGMDWFTREMTEAYWAKMQSVGSTIIHDWHFYAPITALPEYLMMLGVPEFEFPRSDLRPNVHYFGGWKTKAVAAKKAVPKWWDDIASAKKEGKQIVAVSQGTLDPDLTHLLLPTLEALKDRTDVLVVATTVAVEVEDVPDLVVPGNTRIAKFAPYDLLLPLVRFVPIVVS